MMMTLSGYLANVGSGLRGAASVALALALWIDIAHAAPKLLVADNDPEIVSSFTVTFPPELGGATQTAEIPNTIFVLSVDEQTGAARLISYFQLVNPLDLLGYSTGNIKVLLGGPSTGAYNAETGTFTTEENYNVYFDDTELAGLGFVSPFAVPGSASGTIESSNNMESGTISMNWGGTGVVDTGSETPLVFTYSCSVNSVFTSTTTVIQAVNDPALENSFTVTFPPELGGQVQTADIPSTEFVLEIDEAGGFGRLLSWTQQVDPFDILGYSTGDIGVYLGGASSGTYDSALGVFDTNEIYDVTFDDTELSGLGFYSPFSIPSSSTGTIAFDTDDSGTIVMNWSGSGELNNPQDPENPYVFNYTCAVGSSFGAAQNCQGDANGDGAVDPLDSGAVLSRLGCAVGSGDADCDAADANADGTVDPLDVGFVLARFGGC